MLWTALVAAAATLAIAGLAYASSSHPALSHPTTVHVIEHADTDTVIDTGPAIDSTGDLLTFHNKLYNRHDSHVVGRDQGVCTRIDPAAGTWECNWTAFLHGWPDQRATARSPTSTTRCSQSPAGTGKYRNARGQMVLKSRDNGAKYDFIYQLLP